MIGMLFPLFYIQESIKPPPIAEVQMPWGLIQLVSIDSGPRLVRLRVTSHDREIIQFNVKAINRVGNRVLSILANEKIPPHSTFEGDFPLETFNESKKERELYLVVLESFTRLGERSSDDVLKEKQETEKAEEVERERFQKVKEENEKLKARVERLIMAQPIKFRKAIRAEEVMMGMNTLQLRLSWGPPESINRTVLRTGRTEQWVYGLGCYVYLTNGIVTGWQTSE